MRRGHDRAEQHRMAGLAVRSNQIGGDESLAMPRLERMKSTQYGCYKGGHSHEQEISAFRADKLGKGAARRTLAVCLEYDAARRDAAGGQPSRTRLEFRLIASLNAEGRSFDRERSFKRLRRAMQHIRRIVSQLKASVIGGNRSVD